MLKWILKTKYAFLHGIFYTIIMCLHEAGLVSACNGLAEMLRPGGKYKAETPPQEAESEYFTSSLSLIWKWILQILYFDINIR